MNEAEKLINNAKTAALFHSGEPIIASGPPAGIDCTWDDLTWTIARPQIGDVIKGSRG